jgi:hypothetical protein
MIDTAENIKTATTFYDKDVIAWAQEQAKLLRAGQFEALDIEHIAEEIEDVGKSERRDLASRMAVLMAHLLKWQYQPDRRGSSWRRTIKVQRRALALRIEKTPSLSVALADGDWLSVTWDDALARAIEETGLDDFPEDLPWTVEQVLSQDFFPDSQQNR